jgi:hypothetical protein
MEEKVKIGVYFLRRGTPIIMRSPALKRRARRSAIVAKMTLTIFREMTRDFGHKSLAACIPELLIAMVIRENDEEGLPPISISEISRVTGIHRKTVGRHINRLVKRGAFIREDDGVYGNDAYLEARLDDVFFKTILQAIIDADEALSKLAAEES